MIFNEHIAGRTKHNSTQNIKQYLHALDQDGDEEKEDEEIPVLTEGTVNSSAGKSWEGGNTPERPSTPEDPGVGAVPRRPRRRATAAAENGDAVGGGSRSGNKKDAKRKGGQASASLATEVRTFRSCHPHVSRAKHYCRLCVVLLEPFLARNRRHNFDLNNNRTFCLRP